MEEPKIIEKNLRKQELAVELIRINKSFRIKENRPDSIREMVLGTFSKNKVKNVKALQNINLTVTKGETIGIIGRNGSGKSTLLNIIMESIKPDKGGSVFTDGKLIRLALGMGVDANLTARDNIYVNGSVLGLTFRKIGKIFSDILNFAGLEEFVDTPVKFYSKGMKQRLLFSIAMHAEADIFLLDEFFGGTGDQDFKVKSDIAFREKILEGKTIIIVSHNLNIITRYCNKAMLLDKGTVEAFGDTPSVVKTYQNSFKKN